MKYLTSFGALWRLSNRAYRQFLRDVVAGREWDLNDYGPMIARDVIIVSDIDKKEASEKLAELGTPKGR